MATGTGVDAQLGFVAETTVGTGVTVTHFVEFVSETMDHNPTWIEPAGLGLGAGNPQRGSRVVQAHADAAGSVVLEVANRGFGLLWKQCLGSSATAVQIGTTTAYTQVHQLGSQNGKSLTVQVGRPEPSSGTVQPFTFRGVKVKSWQFDISDSDMAKLTMDLDAFGQTTVTSLASASITTGAYPFNFSQISAFKLGGTVATTNSVVVISTSTAITAVVKSFSLKCDWGLITDRWGLGLTDKAEQLPVMPTITYSISAEFKKSEWYDVYIAKTLQAMQLTFTGAAISTSGHSDSLDFVIASQMIKAAKVEVSGPGLVTASIDGQVYWDETNNALQVTSISADSVL